MMRESEANVKLEITSLAIGIGIGVAVVLAAVVLASLPTANILDNSNGTSNDVSQQQYPSIEIEMPRTTYQVGQHLDFTIHTYGICATPNVSIWRDTGNGEAILVYQYVAGPITCPPPQSPDQPHLKWKADQLVQRISNENFGGDGNSLISTSAAITLKKAGDYLISASLPDRSKDVSVNLTVTNSTG